MKIKDLPKIERPRERLISKGTQNLKDLPRSSASWRMVRGEELLAILLRTGREGKNVLDLARQILNKYSKKRFLKENLNDLEITKRIQEAGKIMGIDVLDHVIITKTKIFSFKEKKLI